MKKWRIWKNIPKIISKSERLKKDTEQVSPTQTASPKTKTTTRSKFLQKRSASLSGLKKNAEQVPPTRTASSRTKTTTRSKSPKKRSTSLSGLKKMRSKSPQRGQQVQGLKQPRGASPPKNGQQVWGLSWRFWWSKLRTWKAFDNLLSWNQLEVPT